MGATSGATSAVRAPHDSMTARPSGALAWASLGPLLGVDGATARERRGRGSPG